MNAAPGTIVQRLVGEIRDCCGELRRLTRWLLDEFSLASLEETVEKRALLLLKIDSHKATLEGIADPRFWAGCEQYREARDHIAALGVLDREVALRTARRMGEIRSELSALAGASHVAKNYMRHCRT